MANPQEPCPAPRNWKLGLALGLAIGVGSLAVKALDVALVPSLGYWGACVVSTLAASVVAAVVSVLILKLRR
jgi:hypothetical protein